MIYLRIFEKLQKLFYKPQFKNKIVFGSYKAKKLIEIDKRIINPKKGFLNLSNRKIKKRINLTKEANNS